MIVKNFLKSILKLEISSFEIDKSLNNLQIVYEVTRIQMRMRQISKFFTNFAKLHSEIKILQKCGLQHSKAWIFTFNLRFCWALYDFLSVSYSALTRNVCEPENSKNSEICVHIEEFIRNTKVFFVCAQFQFKGMKHPFEENRFFSFEAYIVETIRDREKCSNWKLNGLKSTL